MYRSKKFGSLEKGYMVYSNRLSNHAMVEVELNSGYTYSKELSVTSATHKVSYEVSTSGLVYIKAYEFSENSSSEHYYILDREYVYEALVSIHVYHYE